MDIRIDVENVDDENHDTMGRVSDESDEKRKDITGDDTQRPMYPPILD